MSRRPANILLVDDTAENLLALEAILDPLGQRIVRARSGEEALRAMLQHEFACVLLDVQMPGMDGYEVAEFIKARERTRHVPIIFLTAIDRDDHAARRGYDAGAVDYLFKPFDPIVLRSKVQVFIDLFHLKREAEELAHRAQHDPLTGLPNRVLFRDRLERAVAATSRVPSSVAVLYVDLDGFKPVNDTLGHEAGDALLIELSERLAAVLRGADTVARLGGDEFAILLATVDGEAEATAVAERVVNAVGMRSQVLGERAKVSASVGVAVGAKGVEAHGLLRAADAAMYVAKGCGGGCWRVDGDDDAEEPPAPVAGRLDNRGWRSPAGDAAVAARERLAQALEETLEHADDLDGATRRAALELASALAPGSDEELVA